MSTGASQIDVEIVREALAILGIGAGGGLFATISLSATQNANINAGDHIELDTIKQESPSSGITVSAGAGQLAGLVTLPQGHVFKLSGYLNAQANSATNNLILQFRNNTDALLLGPETRIIMNTNSWGSTVPIAFIDTEAEAKEIEIRIISEVAFIQWVSNLGGNGETYITVEEV